MTAAFFPAQDEVRQWLQDAAHIAMLTGAGVSAESGVPTFRDAQTGLWANFRAEDLATEAAFRRDPQRVWDWYAERRANMVHVQPNAGHHAVAAFQHRHHTIFQCCFQTFLSWFDIFSRYATTNDSINKFKSFYFNRFNTINYL